MNTVKKQLISGSIAIASILTIEQAILEKMRSLPLEKQQEILDFAEFLVHKFQPTPAVPSRGEFYGCIQDETFIRHPQDNQRDR